MIRLLTIILLLTNIAHAEEGIIKEPLKYDVEIIIFEDANARYLNSEYWPQNAIIDVTKNSKAKLHLSKTNKALYKNIKPQILSKEYRRMKNSKDYNVLFFGSWRQTGLEAKKAFSINIEALTNNHKGTSKNRLTGNLRLVLARYLHIYSELDYQRHTATEVATETTTQNAPLHISNHRRMRSKELHYIDHPLLGMLIQINPVKPAQ
ncbi:hypothetical protein MNBD_GAMMA06-1920 [hydrothermal vent metagenome]|uniref:Uncharacterized protein n=1 Tax=hydrothermal vent metagenome TaxID=652676 RepID=A0A3B0WCK6_9ZZZZ